MQKEQTKIVSNYDGLELDVLVYIPEQIKGIVLIAHGMSEHKERYIPFLEFLCSNGYVACINDHRGHGKSIRSESDYGFFYDKTGNAIKEDTQQLVTYLKDRFKNEPLYLFGHSMGSLVVRAYARKHDKEIDKLIVCGSPSYNPAISIAITLVDARILSKGERYISKTFEAIATGGYDKSFPNESRNSWLSVNKQNVTDYNNDKGCGFPFTLNGYRNLFVLLKETYNKKGWVMENPDLPILFISGSDDPCAISKEKWLEAIENMKSHGYKNIDSKMYQGYRHEILNEEIKEDVYKDVLDFLNK